MRYFTSFGEIEAESQDDANRAAYVRWLEEGWAQGGYKPMTRAEFEAQYLAPAKE
jgi:hypothetical protein